MTIIIKELDGTELINEQFGIIDVVDKNISLTFTALNIILGASLDPDKLYNATFEGAENLGLSGTMMVKYVSYNFNASTAFSTNELGEKVPSISINSNSLQVKKY
jgi:hypothetical protein